MLWDLDAHTIRWFELRRTEIIEVTFAVIPDSGSGVFGMPAWKSMEHGVW